MVSALALQLAHFSFSNGSNAHGVTAGWKRSFLLTLMCRFDVYVYTISLPLIEYLQHRYFSYGWSYYIRIFRRILMALAMSAGLNVNRSSDRSCTWAWFYTNILLIHPGCSLPSNSTEPWLKTLFIIVLILVLSFYTSGFGMSGLRNAVWANEFAHCLALLSTLHQTKSQSLQ